MTNNPNNLFLVYILLETLFLYPTSILILMVYVFIDNFNTLLFKIKQTIILVSFSKLTLYHNYNNLYKNDSDTIIDIIIWVLSDTFLGER